MGKVIYIIGPTASGKTDLSIILANHFNTEIISADSRQCYKYLDIGTAKPTKQQLIDIKHHFIDTFDLTERFTAGMFHKLAYDKIIELHNNGKVPIIVGGSGLYIDSLINGLQDYCDFDENLRNRLQRDLKLYGVEYLYNQLRIVDEEYSLRVSSNDWRRILRALEFYYLTNKKFSEITNFPKNQFYNIIINLVWGKDELYQRINKRVDLMLEKGLIEEVRYILMLGYEENINSLNTVGYKEIISYLKGNSNLNDAIELIKKNTRNYAKKQITFFNKYKEQAFNFSPQIDNIDKVINFVESKFIS